MKLTESCEKGKQQLQIEGTGVGYVNMPAFEEKIQI